MIVCVDIGNTHVAVGGFDGETLAFVFRIATDVKKTEDEYAVTLRHALALHSGECASIEGAIISSVVPALSGIMKKALALAFKVEALTVGPGMKTGINIHCDVPSSVGADLICACVAAHHLYGDPSLVIDMGASTNLMVVDEKGAFVGVSIVPGVHLSLQALTEKTAQLPQIDFGETPRAVLGRNTADSMRSGAIYGTAAMLDGMIDRISREQGRNLPVIVTGTPAESIVCHCEHKMTYNAHLVLHGLRILYSKNTR